MNEPGTPASQGTAGEVDEPRVAAELREALADHLLQGRLASDVAQGLLGVLAAYVFWDSAPPVVVLGWLVTLLGSAAVRGLHRVRVAERLPDPMERLRRARVDVWTSALIWGFGGPLLVGPSETDLALLLLIYAGLIAAATSTVVADRPAFSGFTGLLTASAVVVIAIGEAGRYEFAFFMLAVLFTPFMVIVHRRSHAILRDQIRALSRLRMSQELSASRTAFLNALLEAAPNPIVVLGSDRAILRTNPAFAQVIGGTDEAHLGRPLESLTIDEPEQGPLGPFLDRVFAGERSVVETQVRRDDGGLIWMRFSGTASADARVGAAILIGEDVTSQVAIREAREEARIAAEQSARAKSMFLASMSHEIRTPMNGVMGMIELLLDTELTEEQAGWAEILRTSASDLMTILNDVLDVSKIEAGQLSLEIIDFDLPKLLDETARSFIPRANARGIELLLDLGEGVPGFVRGDPVRIRQVLNNLLSNAIKFTESGEVILTARQLGPDGPNTRLRFSVRDTGIGIPPEKLEMIFDEFSQAESSTTRRYGGTGLGLAICRRLVGLMDGTLAVRSRLGEGSEFSFDLSVPVPGSAPKRRRRITGSVRDRHVLVIDDNAATRRIVRAAVESEGGLVDEADGARVGIERIRSRHGTGEAVEVVILDSMMPEMDGFGVAEAIAAMPDGQRPRILMLTSAAAREEYERARALGIGGILEKPASRVRLLQALEVLLAPEPAGPFERRLVTSRTLERLPSAGRILLADDSRVNQHVALAMLAKRGYEVDVVDNGLRAVESACAGNYDLVLMDVEMPEMDGVVATKEIRKTRPAEELPIVALTAHAVAEHEERCRSAGMNDFLSKPFKATDLYEVVQRWIRQEE